MGRWGMRLFEGDQDLDIALEINSGLAEGGETDLQLFKMVNQTDMCAPSDMKAHYETEEYKKELEGIVSDCRNTLNSGIGDKLFRVFRKKEHEPNGKYRIILVGAIVMRAGAVVKDDDFNHLRELVGDIPCRDGLTPALRGFSGTPSALRLLAAGRNGSDDGFRHPGKVQFLAAMEHYRPGVARSFQEPRSVLLPSRTIIKVLTMRSCYNCGKIAADNGGTALSQCSKCKRVWYCNTVSSRIFIVPASQFADLLRFPRHAKVLISRITSPLASRRKAAFPSMSDIYIPSI